MHIKIVLRRFILQNLIVTIMVLQAYLDNLVQIRINFKKLLESLPEQELYRIPAGFSNNVIWNFAHNVVTQQILIYKLAGQPLLVSDKLIALYKKGTTANPTFLEGFKDEIVLLSYSTLEKLQADILTPQLFSQYSPYTTSFGVELNDFDAAMRFNNIHESLHLGYAMALRKALKG
jgi:hypothetical protein